MLQILKFGFWDLVRTKNHCAVHHAFNIMSPLHKDLLKQFKVKLYKSHDLLDYRQEMEIVKD